MNLDSNTVSSQQLGALGLIASTIQELGIIKKIDQRIKLNENKGAIVSYGQRTAAMILNGLGFMNSRLYMTCHYFQDKPVAELLGAEITAEQLNDDCLGRCLDKISEYGVTKLYSEIAFEIANEKGLLGNRFHLDTTSFVLHGEYEGTNESQNLKPAHGYSKAHRHDLKQVMLSLTQNGVANLPLWMEALDGNSSDKRSFHETVNRIKYFVEKLENAPNDICFVVDSAFYDAKKLKELDSVDWITRVPATLKECKSWTSEIEENLKMTEIDENYSADDKIIQIMGSEQHWFLFRSEQAYLREAKTMYRRIDKEYEHISKALWHLSNQIFGCANDARSEISTLLKKNKYHDVEFEVVPIEKYLTKGRPSNNSPKEVAGYRIEFTIASSLDKINKFRKMLGRFVLATNRINQMSATEILAQYKEQSQVESGFKFIKDDAFELDSFFLKTPSRIAALMMIMTLCLMVYNFAQYHIRKCLEENNDVLPNQHGKASQKPTMKWIAEMMVVIAVVNIETADIKKRIITNVNQVHRKIIGYFGKAALKIYGLPEDYKQKSIDYSNYKNWLNWCEM